MSSKVQMALEKQADAYLRSPTATDNYHRSSVYVETIGILEKNGF